MTEIEVEKSKSESVKGLKGCDACPAGAGIFVGNAPERKIADLRIGQSVVSC